MRADLLSEAWLWLRCKAVPRVMDLFRGGEDGLDLFLLADAVLLGFVFLPRPRREPLLI